MKVLTLPVGQMQTNCYIAIDEKSGKAVVIDPGDDADYIMRRIQDEQADLQYIIATHGHFDHIMAVTELKLAYNIPFLIHENDLVILRRHKKTAQYFLNIEVLPPPPPDSFIKESMKITFGETHLHVLETPGHTPGSICLYDGEHTLFSGDTIFAQGNVGRTDLDGGDQAQLYRSIRSKILPLPDHTIVFSGHGESTILQEERKYYEE